MAKKADPAESGKRKTSIGKVFRTIIWPRRGIISIGLVLIIINRLAGLVLPGATKFLIDNVIANKDLEMLRLLLFAVAGALIVQATTSFSLTKLLSVEAQHFITKS